MEDDIAFTDPDAYLENLGLLIKPAGPDCNLQCDYCFYLPKHEIYPGGGHEMSREVRHKLIGDYMQMAGGNPSFGWQGGEPTLLGLDFFRRVVAVQRQKAKAGQAIANGLQTNGILLDDEWARFLARYNFLVGLSLDGPEYIHDYYRRDAQGNGSFNKVMKAMRTLRKHRVEFNHLCMVTDYSQDKADEIYDFFMKHNLHYLQFVPCIERDPQTEQIQPYSCTPEGYGEFLCQIFDRWSAEIPPDTYIRMMDDLLTMYMGHPCPSCVFRETCGDYLLIEHNGDVYPCDFFVEEEYYLGNLLETPLREIALSDKFMEFRFRKKEYGEQCSNCRWEHLCHGGCQRHRITGLGTAYGPSYFCESYHKLFDHADARLREMADEMEQRHPEGIPQPGSGY